MRVFKMQNHQHFSRWLRNDFWHFHVVHHLGQTLYKISRIIYFLILTQYKFIIGQISPCDGVSIKNKNILRCRVFMKLALSIRAVNTPELNIRTQNTAENVRLKQNYWIYVHIDVYKCSMGLISCYPCDISLFSLYFHSHLSWCRCWLKPKMRQKSWQNGLKLRSFRYILVQTKTQNLI